MKNYFKNIKKFKQKLTCVIWVALRKVNLTHPRPKVHKLYKVVYCDTDTCVNFGDPNIIVDALPHRNSPGDGKDEWHNVLRFSTLDS
jgi:hypothetical protein